MDSLKINEPEKTDESIGGILSGEYLDVTSGVTEWIISVDMWHNVSIIKAPNAHPRILAYGNAEEIGIPCELPDTEAGLYLMRCSYYETRDSESGRVDDWGFKRERLTLIMGVRGFEVDK